jgi:hypothetical protein
LSGHTRRPGPSGRICADVAGDVLLRWPSPWRSPTAGRSRGLDDDNRDVIGRETSAGTYATKRDADRAWQRAEAKVAEGRIGTTARGWQSFQRYVEDEWLPNHVMEPSTREG